MKLRRVPIVSPPTATEISDGKIGRPPSPREQSQTCTSSSRNSSQDSSQHRASTSTGQEFIPSAIVVNGAVASSVLCANPIALLEPTDGDNKPVADQVSSSAKPYTDSHSCKNISWLQEPREKQQARYLRHESNWSYITQRSLPPKEIPRIAKEWPALGHIQSRTEELEFCNDPSECNSRVRVKPRFRNFCASSSYDRQDLKPVEVEKSAITHGKCKESEDVEERGASCDPKLVMLNKDFIVTSPVRENLLLTIALTSQRRGEEELEPSNVPHQILIGRFTAFSSFLRFKLCHDALRVKFEQNAGGSSTISESLSVEYFARRFQAQDVVTEMEVEYWSSNWKKVDYICTLYGQRVGVSVTRAMSYPDPHSFCTEIAHRLLHKKLYGLVVARDGVSKRHSFCKCILHVWCETQRTAEIMKTMYAGVKKDLEISDDVIMVLTVADGLHARPIFYEHALHS